MKINQSKLVIKRSSSNENEIDSTICPKFDMWIWTNKPWSSICVSFDKYEIKGTNIYLRRRKIICNVCAIDLDGFDHIDNQVMRWTADKHLIKIYDKLVSKALNQKQHTNHFSHRLA